MSEFLEFAGHCLRFKAFAYGTGQAGKLVDLPPVDTLVAFDNENRRQGYQIAQKLREEGRRVELLSRASEGVDPQEYARARDISEIIDISEKDRGDFKW